MKKTTDINLWHEQKQRRNRMQMACQHYDEIMALVKSASFQQLQAYHEKLYNFEILEKVEPKRVRPSPLIEYGDVSGLHYFSVDRTAYCLPPKAGSTNWLKTLRVHKNFKLKYQIVF